MKITHYIAAIAVSFLATSALADETLYYCPSSVTCSQAGDATSCQYQTPNADYWDHIETVNNSQILAATYQFYSGGTTDYGQGQEGVGCAYINTDQIIPSVIMLMNKPESHLIAYHDSTTQWAADGSCTTDSPQSCPFKIASVLGIFNNVNPNLDAHLALTANNVPLKYILVNEKMDYAVLTYEAALAGCGTAQQCTINFTSMDRSGSGKHQDALLGSVLVDMQNKMKIVQMTVNPVRSEEVTFTQKDPFNTLDVSYYPNSNPAYALQIYNYIDSSITAKINNVAIIGKAIANKDHVYVNYDKSLAACAGVNECQIDLTTAQGGVLGSVIVDMKNNMNVLKIMPFRSTEIQINQLAPNQVEVREASK